ncbi:MAG: nitroreductase family protein, partial [Promethearchaeota archaeon]
VFLKTVDFEKIKEYYISKLKMSLWLDQGDCIILKKGNLLLGFCKKEEGDSKSIITFFYPSKEAVDKMYDKLKDYAIEEPTENKRFQIYHFFARDPENRMLEFQYFLHSLDSYLDGNELLIRRRSIRSFEEAPVPQSVLWKIFETCRYSPTSRNSQSFYFVVIDKEKNPEKMNFLASLRGRSSEPIARAPLAVAICSDSSKTMRMEQDGCIAAYHFILTSWFYGLGTCWIAAMNTNEVKKTLGIPQDHYVATITPLGYPKKIPAIPVRREAKKTVRFL